MNKDKEKKQEKPKQWKVGITEKGMELLNQYLEMANKSSKRKIRTPEVLELAVEKLNEKDIRKIQERVYTPDDKMEVMLDEYNLRNPDRPLSMEQFKTRLVETYEKQTVKGYKNALNNVP